MKVSTENETLEQPTYIWHIYCVKVFCFCCLDKMKVKKCKGIQYNRLRMKHVDALPDFCIRDALKLLRCEEYGNNLFNFVGKLQRFSLKLFHALPKWLRFSKHLFLVLCFSWFRFFFNSLDSEWMLKKTISRDHRSHESL